MKSLFLFFKQKTAYEMRISDWSSDVCSSDLIGRRFADRARILEIVGRCAVALFVFGPVDHEQAGHAVALLLEQMCGDRRIDATGQTDDHMWRRHRAQSDLRCAIMFSGRWRPGR